MELKEIASVRGQGGLFRILKTTSSKVILQPLNNETGKMLALPTQGITLLAEISIYVHTKEETVPLEKVLQNIWKKFEDQLDVDANSEGSKLKAFMKSVLPDYHEERVYVSDIKKLLKWYPILLQHTPEAVKGKTKPTKSKEEKGAPTAKKVASKEGEKAGSKEGKKEKAGPKAKSTKTEKPKAKKATPKEDKKTKK